MILAMGDEHAPEVARLHCAALGGLLTRLGGPAALAYYRGAIRTGLAVAYVAVEDGAVRGFVCGSARPDRLLRSVCWRNPVGIARGVCLGLLRHPSSLILLASNLREPGGGAYDPHVPELTYIATAGDHRGGGIGRQLVGAFIAALRGQGAVACELSVDDDNRGAVDFYEKLGFRLCGRYREFGAMHRRYRIELGVPPAAGTGPS